jgi:hypothetical protein
MGESEAREGFGVRLEVVTQALARLDPLHHRKLIEDLQQLRDRYQSELDRSDPEGTPRSADEQAKGDTRQR